MDLRQYLAGLKHVKGPNASGEYSAQCPGHDDKQASLTVTVKQSPKDGKERILPYCHAGCTFEHIIGSQGYKPYDMIVNPDPPKKYSRKKSKPAATPTPVSAPAAGDTGTVPGATVYEAKPVPDPQAKAEPKIDFAHPTRVYSYTDASGKELFQVCRYEYVGEDGKRAKTFRQRVYDPKNPNANRAGYVNSVPNELRDTTLYHMPGIAAAIREGRTVYVVEGEKDVETLERLGYTATCNPGGAGKWRDGYTAALIGADVVILPDCDTKANDYTGQNHALSVALSLKDKARRVRLINLREACPKLPPKGDITDMVQMMGDAEAMDALARQIARTRDFDAQTVPFWLTPAEQAAKLYGQVEGYGAEKGGIVQITGDGTKPLTDFIVLPRLELIHDDGATRTLQFVFDGWDSNGTQFERATINSSELNSMAWLTDKWGFHANIRPGTANRDKVVWAIKKVGQIAAKQVTEYSHTGWRQIDGKWCYLYHGGAIGMDGITVDMGDALKAYRLDGQGIPGFEAITYKDAAMKSLQLQTIVKPEIGIALLGTTYLAPLREFMAQSDITPAFCLFLYGESGTHKTTAAALAMAHYGNFHAKNPPASFNDTANQIRKKAFLIKDAPILVDDYHPTTSQQEKRQMAATAQALSRAFGDGSDRGRLNADTTIRTVTPPRSVGIITGEDLPAIGASGLARFFVLDIDKDDIPITAELTSLQEAARAGYLQKSMRGYITWLSKQTDTLPDKLQKLFVMYREDIRKSSNGAHDRAPEAVACIMMGYQMMLQYMRDIGAVDGDTALAMIMDAKTTLTETSQKQTKSMESEKPTRIFLDVLAELMASKEIYTLDLHPDPENPQEIPPAADMVGYEDDQYYYLLPNVAYARVSMLCRQQGVEFPVTSKALYKHLRTDGILTITGDGGSTTKAKFINGKLNRLLWIPRDALGAPASGTRQMQMDFTAAGREDLPDGWK